MRILTVREVTEVKLSFLQHTVLYFILGLNIMLFICRYMFGRKDQKIGPGSSTQYYFRSLFFEVENKKILKKLAVL